MGKTFYMRISTQEERGKQKYTRQESALQRYATAYSVVMTPHNTFRDDCSGKLFDRPEWKELESDARNGDTIVFKDLNRFTREAENGYAEYQKLKNGGINLIFLESPTVSTAYIKRYAAHRRRTEYRCENKPGEYHETASDCGTGSCGAGTPCNLKEDP